jgi:O-antigen ligase
MIVAFATQSALTFSRTGLYCACGGILAASIGLIRDMRTRLRFILAAVTVACVANYVLIPVLDTFTKGHISKRFTESNTSGRDTLMKKDLDVFLENPLLGVGPGASKANHQFGGHRLAASHSEVTRLLAEHGCLGMAALLLLGLTAFLSYRRSRTNMERSVKMAFLSWCLIIMASNAMRYVAPSFIFGVCSAVFAFDETDEAKS